MAEHNEKDIREAALNEMRELAKSIAEGAGAQSIATACKLAFDLYSGFVKAGFTEQQSMCLLTTMMKGAVGGSAL